MLEIRNMSFGENGNVGIENWIRITRNRHGLIPIDNFWGTTEIRQNGHVKFSYSSDLEYDAYLLLSYVNEISALDMNNELKKLIFHIGNYEPETKEGYIIFVKKSAVDINTNGKRVFGRTLKEGVIILKNGEYIEVGERRIEVVNNQLMLYI